MIISQLRHLIYIHTPTATQSSRGAETITWSRSPALRGRIRTVGGDERSRDDQVIAVAVHEVVIRWPLPDGVTLTTKSRIEWLDAGVSRYFGITAIGEPDNRGRMVSLSCMELVGEDRVL
jgi:head-tail adaptor